MHEPKKKRPHKSNRKQESPKKKKKKTPCILSIRFLISREQASQCMWAFNTTVITWGCSTINQTKMNIKGWLKSKVLETRKRVKRLKITSSFFSSGFGGAFSSAFFSSSAGGGFGIGDRISTCLWLFLWTLSKTFNGSAFSPFTITLCVLQSVSTSSTPAKYPNYKKRRLLNLNLTRNLADGTWWKQLFCKPCVYFSWVCSYTCI